MGSILVQDKKLVYIDGNGDLNYLYPKTYMSNITVSYTDDTPLSTYLGNTYAPLTHNHDIFNLLGAAPTSTNCAHTTNVDDWGNRIGTNVYNNNDSWTKVLTVSGTGITGILLYVKYQSESTSYDYGCVWEGNNSGYTASGNYGSSISGKLGNSTMTSQIYIINSTSCTVAWVSDGSVNNYYGFYALAIPLHGGGGNSVTPYVTTLQYSSNDSTTLLSYLSNNYGKAPTVYNGTWTWSYNNGTGNNMSSMFMPRGNAADDTTGNSLWYYGTTSSGYPVINKLGYFTLPSAGTYIVYINMYWLNASARSMYKLHISSQNVTATNSRITSGYLDVGNIKTEVSSVQYGSPFSKYYIYLDPRNSSQSSSTGGEFTYSGNYYVDIEYGENTNLDLCTSVISITSSTTFYVYLQFYYMESSVMNMNMGTGGTLRYVKIN